MANKILIQPIINNKEYGYGVQGNTFNLGIKLTNESNTPSTEFRIVKVLLTAEQGQNFTEDFNKEQFDVPKLNPHESITIKIGQYGHFLYGLVNISIHINISSIELIQRNPFTKICTNNLTNLWTDFFYIKSLNEYEQERTNFWMIILTILIALLTIVMVIKS